MDVLGEETVAAEEIDSRCLRSLVEEGEDGEWKRVRTVVGLC